MPIAGSGNYLYDFGQMLQQQFNLNDNKNAVFNTATDAPGSSGTLGDLSGGFDQSAQRSYTEQGFSSVIPFNPTPKQLDILSQNPDITVLIKKRAFASLAENFRPDVADQRDLAFYTATKVLFNNKAKQIAAYERLTKFANVSLSVGQLDTYILPILFQLTDNLTSVVGGLGGVLGGAVGNSLSAFSSIVNQVRQAVALSLDNEETTWITNMQNSFQSTLGQGTGVIELTNVSNLGTVVSTHIGGGTFNLTIQDPYNLMLITHDDIEQAISDTNNIFYSNSLLQLATTASADTISLLKQQLNAARTARNTYLLQFMVQPADQGVSRVVVIMPQIGFQVQYSGGGLLQSVNIDQSALQGSSELGNNGLSPSEASMVQQIISQLLLQITTATTAQNQTQLFNQNPIITYVRKKLRLHYAKKLIVQPMDNVHIYIRSYKQLDTKISMGFQGSFFNGGDFLQSTAATVQDVADAFGIDNTTIAEKAAFVGNDFPTWLWTIFKPWFMSENDGAHVFAGVVGYATSSYSEGSYTATISGKGNDDYFNYGVVNIKPALDVYNGPLYDPLTPFDIKFDTITGFQTTDTPTLLPENSALMNSAFARFKNGVIAGIPIAQNSYLIGDSEQTKSLTMRRVFYDPDGMVYRWKEGIGTLVGIGDLIQGDQIVQDTSFMKDPFAGQDIMNVISLLITGEPYNYATYFKAVAQFDSYFSRDPASNQDPSNSYFRTLQNNLKYRNLLYGNFVPFKSLVIDEQTQAKMMYGQLSVQGFNAQLQSLLNQRAQFASTAILTGAFSNVPGIIGTAAPNGDQTIQDINNLDTQINGILNQITSSLKQIGGNQPITVVGDDVSFNSNPNLGTPPQGQKLSRKDFRREVAVLTRRLSWKVRANQDANLFIVDDVYDKDVDIQAFDKAIVVPDLFKSDYTTVQAKVNSLLEPIGLEVFATTQGHIIARNPKYNMMPSSVLLEMFQLNSIMGVQVFPQYLQDLFVSQIDTLQIQIESYEDQIRLLCLSLGITTDADCLNLINKGAGTGSNSSVVASTFTFLTDQANGTIAKLAQFTQYQSAPDLLLIGVKTTLQAINSQLSISAFTVNIQANIIQASFQTAGGAGISEFSTAFSQVTEGNLATLLTNRLLSRTGQEFPIPSFGVNPTSLDVFNVVSQLSTLIQQRQSAVQAFADALKNTQESLQLNQSGVGNKLSNPSLLGAGGIPQILEHMIEDETFDDLGPGSHNRFRIRNRDILNWTLTEERPEYTAVEVTGRLGDNWIATNQLPQGLAIGQNGNAITTTTAVDYDLWRMYGIKLPQHIDAPYLQNPDTQAPIYAVSLLNRMRSKILSGTMSIVGNEYQQQGEVIYVEDLDRLYYIESVSHNFTYGSQFTTELALSYGHSPGEFVPTPLDVLGKPAYKNMSISNFTHKKQDTSFNQAHLGVVAGSFSSSAQDDIQNGLSSGSAVQSDILNGTYGVANSATITAIINQATGMLMNTSGNFTPLLEIRYYFNTGSSKTPGVSSSSSYAQQIANALLTILTTGLPSSSSNAPTDTTRNQPNLQAFANTNPPQIVIQAVDCSSTKNEFRSPSSKAYYLGRQLAQQISSSAPISSISQTAVDQAIYNYIADCWIFYGESTQ